MEEPQVIPLPSPLSEGAIVTGYDCTPGDQFYLWAEGGFKFQVYGHTAGLPEDAWTLLSLTGLAYAYLVWDTDRGGEFYCDVPDNMDRVRIVAAFRRNEEPPTLKVQRRRRTFTGNLAISTGNGQTLLHGHSTSALAQILQLMNQSAGDPAGGVGQALVRWAIPAGGITQAIPGLPPFTGIAYGEPVGPQIQPPDANTEPPPPPPPPELLIAVSDVTVDEGGVAVFRVSLSEPATERTLVSFTTIDGTAVSGTDYEAVSGSSYFEVGQSEKFVGVQTHHRSGYSGDRMFRLEASLAGASSSGTCNVVETDLP